MSYDWITNAARHASLHIKPKHTPVERTEIIIAKIKQVLGDLDCGGVNCNETAIHCPECAALRKEKG